MRKKKLKTFYRLAIESVADKGYGIARYEGKVVFVEKTIPGDVVDVRIQKNKTDYAMGFPEMFHTLSPLRIPAFCTHFGICGGCTWQNISYITQLQLKKQLVEDAFRRIGKVVDLPNLPDVIASPYEKYYRNKLEFTFSQNRWLTKEEMDISSENLNRNALGFHIPRKFDKILDIQHCYLQPALSNEIRLAIKSYGIIHGLEFYNLNTHAGFLRNVIIRNTSLQQLMVIVIVAQYNEPLITKLMRHLHQTFPEITSLHYVVNDKMNDTIYDLPIHHFAGEQFITEQIENIQYRLGPKSFFQTNTEQAKNLYKIAIEMAGLQETDLVFDLYTGLGSIALLMADKCRKVVGVETVESAVEDARLNASINGIDNCEFVCGNMDKMFNQDFVVKYGSPDVIITDPPRAGMHKDVVTQILALAPKRIVYISCNPATQARDIQLLSAKYRVAQLQPVDMFPHTFHIENIALLEKFESKQVENSYN